MKTTINLKYQGVRGGEPQYQENKGVITSFVEGKENGSITVDAFQGVGEDYKRREIPLVRVVHGGSIVFEGDFSEFINKISQK